jgi:chlorophyllide a reductase subunit Z
MGYAGAVYVVQEIVNGLYDALFNFLPVDKAYAALRAGGAPTGLPQAGNLKWHPEARAQLDAALAQLPFIPRISASRELQLKAETLATSRGVTEVTADLVQEALATNPPAGRG